LSSQLNEVGAHSAPLPPALHNHQYPYYTYSMWEIHPSARRHGIADEDIIHALNNIVAWLELDDDPYRYLVAGPDRAGNLIELVVLDVVDNALVIHAMRLRSSTRDQLFGDESK